MPLLEGTIRSAFLMTEPDVASSNATNIQTTLTRIETSNGHIQYILNGRKWWSTGAMDPSCKVALLLARMDYSQCRTDTSEEQQHGAHTIILVDMADPGVQMVRPLNFIQDIRQHFLL